MRRLMWIVPVACAVLACDIGQDRGRFGRDAPPPAAVLAPGADLSLLEKLRIVEEQLDMALEGEPARVLTAEAVTDQLLHAPRDVDWLATGYSVVSRLRQIQARADAAVATLRRGSPLSAIESDLRVLKADVQDLQRQLQLPGGGPAPPTLEVLLAQDPLRDARAPAGRMPAETGSPQPAGPQPLGTPVDPPQDD